MGTDAEKCKGCRWFRQYYHGEVNGQHQFSCWCLWTGEHFTTTPPEKCNREEK